MFIISLQSGDLHGVEVFERLETKGLYTLQTVVVDYRGYRVVCQSIVPGAVYEREGRWREGEGEKERERRG